MKVAVLSGKGGTGKTFISVNMAAAAVGSSYVDCDVEEPNGHLFFKPDWEEEQAVHTQIPQVSKDLCDGCRECVDFCRFNALVYIKDNLYVFNDVCHSCGGCMIVCPKKALSPKPKKIGMIRKGSSQDVTVYSGMMDTGEVTATPVIEELLNSVEEVETEIIDCPPGSACIVMDSIKEADFCVLVAEPTVFGRHNLQMVHELVTLMNKPFGVVLNKCMDGENPSEQYCIENDIRILERINFDKELGRINSEGRIISRELPEYGERFAGLLETIRGEVQA